MEIPLFQVDAFSHRPFGGNPAAVCPLESWLDDATMQAIAAENNLSETAYFVADGDGGYDLRWFTPAVEVDLCGHATLATGFVIIEHLDPGRDNVSFSSKSGRLTVTREDDVFFLDFPSRPASPWDVPQGFAAAIGAAPAEMLRSGMAMAVFEDAAAIAALQPDMDYIIDLGTDGLIVTAPGDDVDFVSRYFAPHAGIPEDPVTGAAHTTLIPYWAKRLGKAEMVARQGGARQGEVLCRDRGERVGIGGGAVLYMRGTIRL